MRLLKRLSGSFALPSFALPRPDVWFVLAVLLVTVGGARLLNTHSCKELDERDWQAYGRMHAWQAAFDALSATCGVGLLLCDMDEVYTPRGRWTLTGLGVLGSLLYLAAALQVTRRLWRACGSSVPLPSVRLILAIFAVLLILSVPVVAGLERYTCGTGFQPVNSTVGWHGRVFAAMSSTAGTEAGHYIAGTSDWNGSAWRAIAAVASLGWLPGAPPRSCAWIYAGVALIGGLGWTVWLLPLPALRRRYIHVPRVLGLLAGYLAFLLLIATLIFALEAPRGLRGGEPGLRAQRELRPPRLESSVLTGQPDGARFARSVVQTVCAATAGIPTEQLTDRNVTEGTRMALAAAMLVGPMGGSAGGGMKWTLLLWALSGGSAALAARSRSTHPATARCLLAGTGCLLLPVLLTTIVALGLQVIETRVASLYQSPPTFAEAFLDASSAVAGGNLSSGLIHTVTDRNLSRGIRQSVDSYQYGMVWLMLAMLLGRVLPLLVLCQAAKVTLDATPRGTPPLV